MNHFVMPKVDIPTSKETYIFYTYPWAAYGSSQIWKHDYC
jgi:hypothetical protein